MQMVIVDTVVCLEEMVSMVQKEMTVILAMLVHVVQKDNVLITLGIPDPRVKWVIKEQKYIIYLFLIRTFIFTLHHRVIEETEDVVVQMVIKEKRLDVV